MLGSAGAVAIAIIALAVIGHGSSHRAGTGAPGRPPALTGGVLASERTLVSELAILRRPQTAADKLPKWAAREARQEVGQGVKLLPGLTRFIATEPSPMGSGVERVYMVVELAPVRHDRAEGTSGGQLSALTGGPRAPCLGDRPGARCD